MRRLFCALIVAFAAFAFATSAFAAQTNLIANGGFETGDFTGWTAATTLASPLCAWRFSSCGWFNYVTPTSDGGSYFADNGFDGSGPGTYTLSQVVAIPAGPATLTWEDYVQASYNGAARTNEVRVLDAAGTTTLATIYSYTVPGAYSSVDTGWIQHSVDVSMFAGQAVEIAFVQTVPQDFTGPAEYDIDNVQLLADAPSTDGLRAGYCAVDGDTWADGSAIATGTFLNLAIGQPSTDAHYTGAVAANFVEGKGITCDAAPAGYTRQSVSTTTMDVGDGFYPYYGR